MFNKDYNVREEGLVDETPAPRTQTAPAAVVESSAQSAPTAARKSVVVGNEDAPSAASGACADAHRSYSSFCFNGYNAFASRADSSHAPSPDAQPSSSPDVNEETRVALLSAPSSSVPSSLLARRQANIYLAPPANVASQPPSALPAPSLSSSTSQSNTPCATTPSPAHAATGYFQPLAAGASFRRHRSRSRSLPTNLFRVQKSSSLPSASSGAIRKHEKYLSSPAALGASYSASMEKAKRKLRKLSAQPPPVNTVSLREIDLQEIFKNPQLRHDIVFDPQLQFRPNLDGERGKRKKLHANRYWHSVMAECRELSYLYWPSEQGDNSQQPQSPSFAPEHNFTTSKLPLLFITLRDILLSLLPAKDRSYVESVIDPDLLMQQLRHCALDFVDLARWLAGVFKAHCAPMRDSWVDQMVQRIELGISSKSPVRLVEGLRMIFAILEAMKLDVANHQIRTLRPILVEAAVDFEQDYYKQIMEKNKVSLDDSVEWYKRSAVKFDKWQQSLPEASKEMKIDHNRSLFVFGLLKIFSCVSDELMSDFPSTFGFDLSRLAGFRAEVRKMVCLRLCGMLYQEMMRTRLSEAETDKFQEDILAVISDSSGNSKWTKNTHALALEISRRVEKCNGVHQLPSQATVNVVSGWLSKHLQPSSDVYRMVEQKLTINIFDVITASMAGCKKHQLDSPLYSKISSFTERLLVLINFHWGVFGKFYVTNLSRRESVVSSGTMPMMSDSARVDDNGVKDETERRESQEYRSSQFV